MVSGIILAAGASFRLGSPKALLRINDKTFLQQIADVLCSARILDIVIVLGSDADRIQETLSWFNGRVVINHSWEKGQLTSIIRGLDELTAAEIHGAIICPVDHPLISQSLIVDLLQGFWSSKKDIIIPTFQGVRGHPVIFAKELFEELRNAPPDVGARAVVHNHPGRIYQVPVNEEGTLINIDTRADYQKYIPKHG